MKRMKKPIIAVDVDDTLVPHFQDLIDWYNQEYGTRVELADYRSGPENIYKWGTTDFETAIRQVTRFYDTPAFQDAKPHKQAVEVLEALSLSYDLIVVTARDTIIEEATHQLLKEHFVGLFGQVHFTAFYSLEGKARTKGEVCREAGAAYLIDDTAENCIEAVEAGCKAILFGDYPWSNRVELPAGVIRCLDWPAVEEYFNGLSRS